MKRSIIISALAPLLTLSLGYSYSSGPLDGYAGDPPQFNNCTACHSSFDLNSGDGSLSITDIDTYTPGQIITFTIDLSDPGQERWGFELTVIDESGLQAGQLIIIDDDLMQLSDNDGNEPDYLKHTALGTNARGESGQWHFDWRAPESGAGPVTFYLAGNAANFDGNNTGDYIYTTTLTLEESENAVGDVNGSVPNDFQLISVYPNPFNSQVRATLEMPVTEVVTADVTDALGHTIVTLHRGPLAPGKHLLSWRPEGASGVYFLNVRSGLGITETKRLVYLR